MAHTLIIDLGGTFATVAFAVDGELDVSLANVGKLRDALKPFVRNTSKPVAGAAKVTKRRGKRKTPPAEPKQPLEERRDLRAIRQWAKAQGYPISERGRGRIPVEAMGAYEESLREAQDGTERAWEESSAPTPLTVARRNGVPTE